MFTYSQVADAAQPRQEKSSPHLTKAAKGIINRTNTFRQEKGRQKLAVSPKLKEASRYFAKFMARTDQYSHNADGNQPAERASRYGYRYCIVSENIAFQFDTAGFTTEELIQGFFQGWKSSPGHRKNMLDPGVTEVGVAVARSKQSGYYYAVQMFGRPKSLRIEFQVVNNTATAIQYELGSQLFPLPPRAIRTHQLCRSENLRFHWPDQQENTLVQPNNGNRYTIRREGQKFRVRKE
ncbi:serine protease [Nitrosococcus oceani]|nr:serine protease [Nitrosococcus oceani]